MESREIKCLMTNALNLGEEMLKCGAEVSRVEDALQRIFLSYGANDVDVLTITSCIVLTVTFSEKDTFTQTRRIRNANIDFARLSELNALSREICATTPAADKIRERLDGILKAPASPRKRLLKTCVGAVLAAGGFAVFFGGSLADFLAAAPVALLIVAFERFFKRSDANLPAYYFFCSLCAGLAVQVLCALFPAALNQSRLMISFIMLVIPGMAFTNSARDFLMGDTISGSLRLLESVLYAACIAGGVAVSLLLTGAGGVKL